MSRVPKEPDEPAFSCEASVVGAAISAGYFKVRGQSQEGGRILSGAPSLLSAPSFLGDCSVRSAWHCRFRASLSVVGCPDQDQYPIDKLGACDIKALMSVQHSPKSSADTEADLAAQQRTPRPQPFLADQALQTAFSAERRRRRMPSGGFVVREPVHWVLAQRYCTNFF
eukprot:SAG11_NODE_9760_length_882_cov_2.284802_1_plen_168_part_10